MFTILSLLLRLALGALAGWIASNLMGDGTTSIGRNIVLGIIGSAIGGVLAGLLGISAASFSIGGIAISVAGACLFIWLARKIAR